MRGQIGFFVIIGLIVIMAVVVTYSYVNMVGPPAGVPSAVAAEQRMVEDYVVNLVRAGADETVYKMESTGGYLTRDLAGNLSTMRTPPMIVFGGFGVAYWQQCDNAIYPKERDIRRYLEIGIENYLRSNLDENMIIEGKPVDFDLDRLSVSVTVQDNKIDPILVNLPTSISNWSISRPYQASYPTMLGEITEFARGFSDQMAKDRALEAFTIAELHSTNILPTIDVLDRCGEMFFLSAGDISTGLRKVAANTARSLVWWEKKPPAQRSYIIPDVGGDTYEDLNIKSRIPYDFNVEVLRPIMIINDKPIAYTDRDKVDSVFPGLPAFASPYCFKPYIINYSVTYPLVFTVDDVLTGNKFRFAVIVNVDDMAPGTCGTAQSVCDDLNCSAEITVEDSSGTPLEGMYGEFGGCFIGTSGSDGVIRGLVKCGTHNLTLAGPGYSTYREPRSYINLNTPFGMKKLLDVNIRFHQLSDTCVASPVDNDSVMLIFEGGHFSSASNVNLSMDYGECMESIKGLSESCRACIDIKSAEECIETTECVESVKQEARCAEGALLSEGQAVLAVGKQDLSMIVINPAKNFQNMDKEKYSFAAMPLSWGPGPITIPEGTEEIKIYVPDSDELVDRAIYRYERKYKKCHDGCYSGMDCKKKPTGGCSMLDGVDILTGKYRGWKSCSKSRAENYAKMAGVNTFTDYNFTKVLEDCDKESIVEVVVP